MDSPFSCLPKWLSLKAGEHLHSLATGGEAEPSPPWQICPDAPSLSRHPHCYGMEPASPGRLSFHASAFASAPISQNFPPESVSPACWWSAPRPRRRQLPHHRSPPMGWGGSSTRRHGARRVACRFLHHSICVAGGHATRIE